jgi:hypothetical protein
VSFLSPVLSSYHVLASHYSGSGCYVSGAVGGCAGTGDGDVMMRFSPAFAAVLFMEMGACVGAPGYVCVCV